MDELKRLYDEDQADRKVKLWEKDNELFLKRDTERLQRVLTLIKQGKIISAADYFHAAMILQHGGEVQHYETAHEFSKKAAQMGYEPECREADPLWLAAAAKDRALMMQGKSQLYGTQRKKDSNEGRWYVYPVDPTITDEERARWHVPPLKESFKRAEELNRQESK